MSPEGIPVTAAFPHTPGWREDGQRLLGLGHVYRGSSGPGLPGLNGMHFHMFAKPSMEAALLLHHLSAPSSSDHINALVIRVESLRLVVKSKLYVYICAHRKPRPVSQLVAQQVPQQFVPPTQSKKEKKDKVEKEKSEKETTSKKNSHKKTRPRLKNVDRSSAQHLEVTVGDLTVIITDFKEKTKSPPASSAASADQHSQSGSSSDNTERGMSRSSSPRGEASSLNGESH
ncbi:PREDICTED: YY1-associated factor 2 [Calidris pugnax]|uniref:YY1-associated factor 2 n=1 Tax=Calidris pugnax TaxID=198806 RepID=UPI00071DEA2A|nr:PREDICTED: YY1-associated factor 2 [Calidris pugnax]